MEILDILLASPWFWAFARIIIVIGVVLISVPFLILYERKLLSWLQDRVGPNRVFYKGLLQTICDGIKLLFKEEIQPKGVDKFIYWMAPAIALLPALTAAATIPWGPIVPIIADNADSVLTPVANVNIGVLWFLAMSMMGVYGIVLAGWSSNNKYALLGGLRSSAQMISYELAGGLALGVAILASGSLELPKIVEAQRTAWLGLTPWVQNWYAMQPLGFVAFIVFLVCMVAETNRAPFDLPEAESELIAGFHTEYSSMKFACFYMGEYANMVILSALATAVFLGGYSFPIPINTQYFAGWLENQGNAGLANIVNNLEHPGIAWLWFVGKVFMLFSFYVWLRATLPRLRYDQLMNLGWKGLLPLSLILLLLTMTWITFGWIYSAIPAGVIVVIYSVIAVFRMGKQKKLQRKLRMVKESVGF